MPCRGLSLIENTPDSKGLGSHVGLVHDGVGGDDPEGAEEQHEEVLGVGGQRGHQPVHSLELLRRVSHLDDREYRRLILRPKDASGNLPEKLLHDAGDRVKRVVLNIDQTTLDYMINPL